MNDLFPVFLRLHGRRALVVGGGRMALTRAGQLLAAGAQVTVVAPSVSPSLHRLAEDGSVVLHAREFVPSDVTPDCFIVIGATDDPALHAVLAREAERYGLLYNAVDEIDHCNFFTPAVVERGDLKIAISTNGQSPVLARRLREELESALPEGLQPWVGQLGDLRQRLKIEIPGDLEVRKRIIEQVIEETIHHGRD